MDYKLNHIENYKITSIKMIGTIIKWIKLQYYRYSTITGLYIMGTIESTVVQLIFFLGAFFFLRYSYAFFAELSAGGISNAPAPSIH